jgi:hypothetical protein
MTSSLTGQSAHQLPFPKQATLTKKVDHQGDSHVSPEQDKTYLISSVTGASSEAAGLQYMKMSPSVVGPCLVVQSKAREQSQLVALVDSAYSSPRCTLCSKSYPPDARAM